MLREFTKKEKNEICDTAVSYVDGIGQLMQRFSQDECEISDIEAVLSERDIEKCDGCDWYFDSDEVVDAPNGHGFLCTECKSDVSGED